MIRVPGGPENDIRAGVLLGCMVQVVGFFSMLGLMFLVDELSQSTPPLALLSTCGPLLWMGPLYVYARRRGSVQMAQGVLIVAGVTFLLTATCSAVFYPYGWG